MLSDRLKMGPIAMHNIHYNHMRSRVTTEIHGKFLPVLIYAFSFWLEVHYFLKLFTYSPSITDFKALKFVSLLLLGWHIYIYIYSTSRPQEWQIIWYGSCHMQV